MVFFEVGYDGTEGISMLVAEEVGWGAYVGDELVFKAIAFTEHCEGFYVGFLLEFLVKSYAVRADKVGGLF